MSTNPEGLPAPEAQPQPYIISARYPDLHSSAQPYHEAQELIRNEELALSAYRLQLRRIEPLPDGLFVTILGEEPPVEYDQQFRRILSTGQTVELPQELQDVLLERRAAMSERATWVEGHYRPADRRRLS